MDKTPPLDEATASALMTELTQLETRTKQIRALLNRPQFGPTLKITKASFEVLYKENDEPRGKNSVFLAEPGFELEVNIQHLNHMGVVFGEEGDAVKHEANGESTTTFTILKRRRAE